MTIRALGGDNGNKVIKIISSYPEIYEEQTIEDYCHAQMYEIVNEEEELIGFFGLAYYHIEREVTLCLVWIEEKYRKQGIFKKIVRFAKSRSPETYQIGVWAAKENEIANLIYEKMFGTPIGTAEDASYYLVRRRQLWRKLNLC